MFDTRSIFSIIHRLYFHMNMIINVLLVKITTQFYNQ